MNKISCRDYFMECHRARRPDPLEYPRCVQEIRIDVSTICGALIESGRPRTRNSLLLFNATQVPPVTGLVCPASLGSSALMFARSRSGIGKGPMNRTLPKQLGRGVWYEA
jgi:hypothetical protein